MVLARTADSGRTVAGEAAASCLAALAEEEAVRFSREAD